MAVLLRNCPEWTIAELGLFMLVKIINTRTVKIQRVSCQVVDGVGAPVLQAGPRLHLLHPGRVRGDGGRGLGRC